MNFDFTEEQLAVQTAARDFAINHVLPGVIERDEKQQFPTAQVKLMGELGFMGMMTDAKYGGSGMDAVSYVLAITEISKVDASLAVVMSVNNSLVCWGLERYGSENQKQKYLIPLASGKKLGAFALSEPEAGSDATAQKTTAIEHDDYYLLNGTKNWITNGGSSDYCIVFAQSKPGYGYKGINAFIVEKGWDGFLVGKKENKLGIRSSDTHTLLFNDVKVPKENRIGADGFGFKFAMNILNGGRLGIASQALGIAAGAYELALAYSKERETFGKPISKHQAISFKLANMATKIEAAKFLCLKAAFLRDKGKDYAKEGAMAKYYASEVAMEVSLEAVQIHGGYGFVKEYHVERMMRDAKITQIYEGTSEIQQIIIAKEILK
jgi:alkylation response protein AidB-like acyl-CoA dehydrogenase